jgi:uncharacterized damage-inducible protein DinB
MMTANDLLILNFEEIRRRSIKLWKGIPEQHYHWKQDEKAMSCIEMVRHVLEGEHWFHAIINNRGSVANFVSPFQNRDYTNVEDELIFAQPYREKFIEAVKNFTIHELENVEIVREELGQRRKLGDYLLRTAYHESVHTGQLLDYLRTIGIDRPKVWD